MKKSLREKILMYMCAGIAVLGVGLISGMTALADGDIAIDETNFPDYTFRMWLFKQSYGEDGVLTQDEIKDIKSLELTGVVKRRAISDMTGIEYFANIEYLDCSYTGITKLDLSKNTALTKVRCEDIESLTSIDLSKNTELKELRCCANSQLSELDLSKNTKLTKLECFSCKLTALDLSKNTELTHCKCDNNQIESLDLSKNTDLEFFAARKNQLKSIDLGKNTVLRTLDCMNNKLTHLDVSNCKGMKYLYCDQNLLTELDVSKLSELESLSCGENLITELDVSELKNLRQLACHINKLTKLDLCNSSDSALKELNCRENRLTCLDVSNITNLVQLRCFDNKLTELKLCRNRNALLWCVFCHDNQLTSLDASLLGNLSVLSCEGNKLSTLYLPKDIYMFETLKCDDDVNKIVLTTSDWVCRVKWIPNDADVSKTTAEARFICTRAGAEDLEITEPMTLTVKESVKAGCDTEGISYFEAVLPRELSRTGEEIIDTYSYKTPAGHTWGGWKVTKEPTLTSEGERTRVCTKDPSHIQTEKIPKLTPSSTPSAAPTKGPVVRPTSAAVPTASPETSSLITDFVKRIYTYVLDREPEAEGAKFWTDELYSFRRTGAEVGLQFIFSDEFTSRGLSDGDYVTVLYRTFFGREPEEDGFRFWTTAIATGTLDRMGVANGFVYSQEWADTCARYGIRSGGDIKPSVDIIPTDATFAFVERMYTTAMKRASDASGKEFWSNELSNFRFTGEQVGAMFFLSDEMEGFGLSNEEFVTRLYKTFMDRDPEEGGFNFWVGYLNDGGSREGAVYGFTRSEEFVGKCIEARILPY